MENIYYRSYISYNFIKELNNIMNIKYNEYKKQIIDIILDECNQIYIKNT